MRKLLFFIAFCLVFGSFSSVSAQNYLAFNSENVRTIVDGAAQHFFNLTAEKRPKLPIIQSFGAVYFTAKDGLNSHFYGLSYGLAYPISTLGTTRLYVAFNPALSARSSNDSKAGNPFLCGLNAPILTELHLGKPNKLTYSVGLGVAYSFINNTDTELGNYTREAFGPIAEASVSVPIAGKKYTLKANYQWNILKKATANYQAADVLGVSVALSF